MIIINIIKKEINLNVRYPSNYQIIHAMQGDHDSIEITATIYDGNDKYNINCDMIEIECITPKRVKKSIKVTNHTENTVTFTLDKNVLSEEGKHEFVIRFMEKPNVSLTTFPAVIYVVQAPIGELTDKEFTTITELVFETKGYLNETIDHYNKLIAEKESIDNSLNLKAPINSPALEGTPTAPTATAGTNTEQIATTAFTQTAVSNHDTSSTAHTDIRDLITELTTRLNALADTDDTTLDQLSEIVAYIRNNNSLIEGITTSKVNVADIVDNLTSTTVNKPLSAKQGKVLKDLIDTVTNNALIKTGGTVTGTLTIDGELVLGSTPSAKVGGIWIT